MKNAGLVNSPELLPDPPDLWTKALGKLSQSLGKEQVRNWLSDAELTKIDGRVATLAVPSRLHSDWIRKRLYPELCEVLGVQRCELEVHAIELEDAGPEEPELPAEALAPAAPPPAAVQVDGGEAPLVLNPDYSFDSFVVGPCNRFAHAAARGVADRPAVAFNPLFLHGSVGLGKTHLLQAIAHHLLDGMGALRIVFLSCEQFVNHFISALQQGDLENFRNRYRQADVLVVDDIQVLANKARTQEEFFHTFNTLHNARKQIVLSSDSPPQEIPALQERLVSRFKWGLVAEVEQPCFETRVAILQAKAARTGIDLEEEVAHFIAENVESNVRELEGTLTRLYAQASLTNRTVDMGLAREILAPALRARSRAIRIDDVLNLITQHFGVKVADLQSKRRTQSVVFPRQVAMFLTRNLTQLSLEEIGGFFGGRDHSTVVYALEKIEQRRRVDSDFNALLGDLERQIRNSSAAG